MMTRVLHSLVLLVVGHAVVGCMGGRTTPKPTAPPTRTATPTRAAAKAPAPEKKTSEVVEVDRPTTQGELRKAMQRAERAISPFTVKDIRDENKRKKTGAFTSQSETKQRGNNGTLTASWFTNDVGTVCFVYLKEGKVDALAMYKGDIGTAVAGFHHPTTEQRAQPIGFEQFDLYENDGRIEHRYLLTGDGWRYRRVRIE